MFIDCSVNFITQTTTNFKRASLCKVRQIAIAKKR